jgi:RHS repeat-associated protein
LVDAGQESWYFYHADRLGSVAALSQLNGQVVERYAYDVFGQVTVCDAGGTPRAGNASAYGNAVLFTGRWWSATTGLYHYRFRDYSPALGRFLQPDPAGTIDGMNLYAYVSNNPLNWIDPWGLCKEEKKGARTGFRNLRGVRIRIVNPVLDFLNINVAHEQFFFSNGDTVGYFNDSRVRWDKEDINEYELTDLVFVDEDILREAIRLVEEQYKSTKYDLLGTKGMKHNCQDFVKRVKQVYTQLGGRIYRNGRKVN